MCFRNCNTTDSYYYGQSESKFPGWIEKVLDRFRSRLFMGWWLHLNPPRHLFFLGAFDLTEIMQTFGFEIVTIKYFSLEQNPFGMQQSILNSLLRKREVFFKVLVESHIKWTSIS